VSLTLHHYTEAIYTSFKSGTNL